MSEIWIVRSTFAKKDEAVFAARELLEARLIACANITAAVTSLYRWEDMVQEEQEVVLWVKTTAGKAKKVCARLGSLNHYQLPAIIAWPISLVDDDFAQWVADEVD
jgi:periplasmic divalent cation tolerance protein